VFAEFVNNLKNNNLNDCSFLTVADSALFICLFPLVILVVNEY